MYGKDIVGRAKIKIRAYRTNKKPEGEDKLDEKTKVLVGVIADQETSFRQQEDYLEEIDDRLSTLEASARQLTEEKISAGEAYHSAIVEKDAEIARLNSQLDMQRKQYRGTIKGLESTIKEREAEANSYQELYNELKLSVLGSNVAPSISMQMTSKDVVNYAKNTLKLRSKYKKAFDLLSEFLDTHEIFTGIPLIEDRIIAMIENSSALKRREKHAYTKASKLNAEKLAYMRIVNDVWQDGDIDRDDIIHIIDDRYQAWLKEQRKGTIK
jgi:hypothetical protein